MLLRIELPPDVGSRRLTTTDSRLLA